MHVQELYKLNLSIVINCKHCDCLLHSRVIDKTEVQSGLLFNSHAKFQALQKTALCSADLKRAYDSRWTCLKRTTEKLLLLLLLGVAFSTIGN